MAEYSSVSLDFFAQNQPLEYISQYPEYPGDLKGVKVPFFLPEQAPFFVAVVFQSICFFLLPSKFVLPV